MRPLTAAVLSLCILLLFAAFVFSTRLAGARGGGAESWWDEPMARFVREQVQSSYVDDLDPEASREAFYRAMDAYVRFDRYCEFIPPERYTRWKEDTQGRYAGLGVKIDAVPEGLHIVGVWPDGPAARAGIVPGETITAVQGQRLEGVEIDTVTRWLKGTAGSVVTVAVAPGPRPETGALHETARRVDVTRDVIRPPTTFLRRVGPGGRIGVLRLTDFTEETAREIEQDLAACFAPPRIDALVLDLRHNGGGLLTVATDLVDRFLDRGVIVRMEGRVREGNRSILAQAEPSDLLGLPVVVLVDGRSASASEVVAGAFQDHRRAVVLGTRTYGKFLVQSIVEIPRRGAGLKLTTSRYYLPSGRSFQAPGDAADEGVAGTHQPSGLMPDVVVTLTAEQELRLLQQWANEEGVPWGETPRYTDVPADEIDPQLAEAVRLLGG